MGGHRTLMHWIFTNLLESSDSVEKSNVVLGKFILKVVDLINSG